MITPYIYSNTYYILYCISVVSLLYAVDLRFSRSSLPSIYTYIFVYIFLKSPVLAAAPDISFTFYFTTNFYFSWNITFPFLYLRALKKYYIHTISYNQQGLLILYTSYIGCNSGTLTSCVFLCLFINAPNIFYFY